MLAPLVAFLAAASSKVGAVLAALVDSMALHSNAMVHHDIGVFLKDGLITHSLRTVVILSLLLFVDCCAFTHAENERISRS